jgi:hypothetical protein
MAHRIFFWKPKNGVNVWLPAIRPLGETLREELRNGRESNLLDAFPAAGFLAQLQVAFDGSRTDDKGYLHWTDELDNGFVAHSGPQFVEVCLFDVDDEAMDKLIETAEQFGCEHYDWGN